MVISLRNQKEETYLEVEFYKDNSGFTFDITGHYYTYTDHVLELYKNEEIEAVKVWMDTLKEFGSFDEWFWEHALTEKNPYEVDLDRAYDIILEKMQGYAKKLDLHISID